MKSEKSFLDEENGIEWYTCNLCGYPKSGPHAPTDTFSKIMMENGIRGRRAAMKHIEDCHPEQAKEIYAEMHNGKN